MLYQNVDRLPGKIFKCKAKILRVVVNPVRELEVGEHVLQLMQDVVIHHLPVFGPLLQILGLLIIGEQDPVAKCRGHVELLKHRAHIANSAQVAEARESMLTAHFSRWQVVPVIQLRNPRSQAEQFIVDEILQMTALIIFQ